jgi:GDP-fucose transporter C1
MKALTNFAIIQNQMTQTLGSMSKQDVMVTMSVGFYMTTSISMVMLNKLVLNETDKPIFFLWSQLVVAVLCLHAFSFMGWMKVPAISMEKSVELLPLILVNAIGLSANTYCLANVDASLFQVNLIH